MSGDKAGDLAVAMEWIESTDAETVGNHIENECNTAAETVDVGVEF